MAAAPEGTVTLLFTDIEGSTRLLARTGERYADLLAVHHRLLRRVFDAHGGYEVDTAGDAFFVTFSSAKEAVTAAAEAQQALAAHAWPEGERIWVRMGLHTGEPRLIDSTYVGLDVHHAARVMAAGHGGQVLLAQSTRELLGEHANVRDLGEHRLKDLSSPQRLYQLQVEGLPVAFPALKTLENRPTNLPVQPTPLIGRERELGETAALLARDDVRLLTLTGPGGTGKTRLALQVAASVVDEFADGVFFVSLATVADPDLVVPTLAQTLGLRERPDETLLETVIDYLREREMLLLLDNLEQIPESASDIAKLLAAAPKVTALATSRQPLNLSGERLYSVPPLDLPDLDHLDAETLRQNESVRLFTIRAEATRQDFAVTDINAQAVAEICVRLDGLPLALELAAARIRVLSPQAMLTRLDQSLKLLTGGSKDRDQRQRTLRATIEWSYDLLTAPEQLLFARLGVFLGGCRLDAAEAVCDPDKDLGIDVFDGITSLVEKSLLRQRDDPDGEPRFWMLETIREYAMDHLTPASGRERAEEALAQQVVALAVDARRKSRLDGTGIWLARLDAEQHNIRFVLDWLIVHNRGDDAAEVLAGVWFYWLSRGHAREGIPLAEKVTNLDYARPLLRGQALVLTGELLGGQGLWSRARPLKEQALAIFVDHGDQSEAAATLTDLGAIAAAEGDLTQAHDLCQRGLALRETLGAPDGIAHALLGLADVELQQANYEVARPLLGRVIEIARQTGTVQMQILCIGLTDLGELERREGNLPTALSLLHQALTGVQETGDLYLIQLTLDGIARVIGQLGNAEEAARLWGASEAIREQGGFVLSENRHYDQAVTTARHRLPEEDFRRAWNAGRLMTVEQAVAAALQSP